MKNAFSDGASCRFPKVASVAALLLAACTTYKVVPRADGSSVAAVELDGGTAAADSGGSIDSPVDLASSDQGGGGDCTELAQPVNGLVMDPDVVVGSIATYSCNLGSQLKGAATRTCQSDGTWSGTAPTCGLKDCGPLTAPKEGTVMASQTTYGAIATYSCGAGFGPSGSSTRSCQLDGTWSGTQPTCVVANCPALSGPVGGTVVATTLTYGAVASYACDSGYTLAGAATRTCQSDGSWSELAPTCAIRDCGALVAPSNGKVTMMGSSYGASAVFACDAGYTLSGAATVTCQPDSTWSAAPPTCVIKDCGPLAAPANGAVAAAVTTAGSVAMYSCNAGYGLVGGAMRTCGTAATWGGTAPTCAIKDCGPLAAPTNGTVAAKVTTYGATATYACVTGYGPSGSETRTCTAAGTWDGTAPSCVIANCPALNGPAGGSVSAPTLTFGSMATYACNTGYAMTGMATRTCQPTGAWSGSSPTCTITNCGPLTAPSNGTVTALVTTYGATATYACGTGYAANGPLTRTCQADGTWSGAAPACAIRNCGPLLGPTNGTVSAAVTTFGSMATYTCNGGYTASGPLTRTCQAAGTWSGVAPSCVINNCGPLTAPMNGTVNAPITTFGATATYACILGYGPSGSTTRTCQAAGTWSGVAPTCVIANCPALMSPTGGKVSAPTLTFGSTATYSCDAGSTLVGSVTRLCQANSLWAGTQPVCNPNDCGAPGTPLHGAVSAPSTVFKSVATYSCASGYVLSGALTRTCQSDKTWSGALPSCTPVDCGTPPAITNGSAAFSATTFGSTATYSCAANFAISGGSAAVTCGANRMWGARPSCVDVCTIAGNAGTATHCCSAAACPAAAPLCNGSRICVVCPTVPCTVANQPCKVGHFSCAGGTAVCGATGNAPEGQTCSAGASGGECVAGACVACGGDQQRCCSGARPCNLGNICTIQQQTVCAVVGCAIGTPLIVLPANTCGKCGRGNFACCDGSAFTTEAGGSASIGACDIDGAGSRCAEFSSGFFCPSS
jgi:sushi, von Willebrand factor type A, EGF and pentraxin domain-containing protein 1